MIKAVWQNEKTGKCYICEQNGDGSVQFFPVYLKEGEHTWKISKSSKKLQYTVVDLEAVVANSGRLYYKEKDTKEEIKVNTENSPF